MTERKQKWLARSFFVSLFSAGPATFLYWLSTIYIAGPKPHKGIEISPFYTHNALVAVCLMLGWIVAVAIAALGIVFILFMLFESKNGLIPKAWEKTGW